MSVICSSVNIVKDENREIHNIDYHRCYCPSKGNTRHVASALLMITLDQYTTYTNKGKFYFMSYSVFLNVSTSLNARNIQRMHILLLHWNGYISL